MDRFAFLRAMLPARREDAGRSGTGGSKLLFSGASCFFDEDGRVLYFAPTPQASARGLRRAFAAASVAGCKEEKIAYEYALSPTPQTLTPETLSPTPHGHRTTTARSLRLHCSHRTQTRRLRWRSLTAASAFASVQRYPCLIQNPKPDP